MAKKAKQAKQTSVLIKIKENLYVPEDFENDHNYYADAEGTQPYTGVTTVGNVLAKPQLIPWAARMVVEWIKENGKKNKKGDKWTVNAEELETARKAHAQKASDAADHGTDTHALVEAYINDCIKKNDGQPWLDDGEATKTIGKFEKWAKENVDHFLFAERRMADQTLWVAGTADFAYVGKDGKRILSDFKTSASIYDSYWMQVAAYRMLAEHEGDQPYDAMSIVRLGKKGAEDFEVKHLYEYQTAKDAFLACLTLYRAMPMIKSTVVS